MQANHTIHNKIIRLFNGEAGPGEKKEIRAWLNQSDSNKNLFTDLREIWLASGVAENADAYNLEKAILDFKEKIRHSNKKAHIGAFSNLLKIAAIALMLLALPVVYYLGKHNFKDDDTFTTISCAFGDKSVITLPDGSTVHLNSGSTLTFNNDFQQKARKVSLEGEAYFSVKKNTKIPFVVNASDVEVTVMGTEFNVKAYPGENTISTTLAKGKVALKSKYQTVVLKPNQRLDYNRETKKMTLYNLKDITPETEWKDGRLVFRNESLGELELKLERWFDVDIEFADEAVKERRFTGILERESILETVSYFGSSKHVGYKIDNNKIIFYSKN